MPSVRSILKFTQFIAILFVALIVHELGHAFVALSHGVEVQKIDIGFPLLLTFDAFETVVRVGPIPVGAVVTTSAASMNQLALSAQLLVSVAGMLVNLVVSSVAAVFYVRAGGGLTAEFWRSPLARRLPLQEFFRRHEALTGIVAGFLAWAATPLLIPILLIRSPKAFINRSQSSAEIVEELYGAPSDWRGFFWTVCMVNYVIASLNMMPLMPLDGGRVVYEVIGAWSEAGANAFGKVSLFALLTFSMITSARYMVRQLSA